MRRSAAIGLGGILFTPVQQRLFGLLFGQPARRFQSAEIIRLAGSGTGAVHRQLQRLAEVGLVLATREGNQKYYQANPRSPIFSELRGLVRKTVGVAEPLRRALAPVARRVQAAFVFGSTAKKTDRTDSDLDLLIISDELTYPDAYQALMKVEHEIGRPINPVVMSRTEWKQKRKAADSFVKRIAGQPKLFVIGDQDALA